MLLHNCSLQINLPWAVAVAVATIEDKANKLNTHFIFKNYSIIIKKEVKARKQKE